jgi:RNA polymerase sigma-70 factor, ECF subfamily
MSLDHSAHFHATVLLVAADGADGGALDQLVPLLYDELREMAHRHLAREWRDHTLQTTALVHEAYLKMVDDTKVTRRGRAYFFAAAARAMRQVIIDYARKRNADKRGGGARSLSLGEEQIAVDEFAAELLDLDRALEQLAALNPRHAQVVECRFFAEMSVEETAAALNVSSRTVKYDWALARAWLYNALGGGHDPDTATG